MMGISLCMIVRNEAQYLKRCLEAALPWVDELCIVDTGSTDGTVEIAEELGARVSHFEWCDDFSAARNASLEMATMPWILVLDADEFLAPGSGPTLRRAIQEGRAQAWLIYQNNEDAAGRVHPLAVPRLFRNRPEIRFSRPVHESVMEALRELGHGDPEIVDVRVRHVGYLPGVLAHNDKYARNAGILRSWVSERAPDDLFAWYKLAVSLRSAEQTEEREAAFARAYELASAMTRQERLEHPFLPLLYDGHAQCLIRRGDLTAALRVVARGLSDLPQAVELVFRRGDIAWRVGDAESAERYLRACFRPRSIDPRYAGSNLARTVLPAVRLAEVALDRGDFQAASQAVERALGFRSDHRPAQVLAVRSALLVGDVNGATLGLAELLEAAPTCPSVRLLAGELSWLQGDIEGAEQLLSGVSCESDAGHEAMARRAVAAVARGRLDEARELLGQISDRDIHTAAARLLVAVVCGAAWSRSNAFRGERLMRRLVVWVRELMSVQAEDALALFALNAEQYAEHLPGIETLLTRDEPAVEAGR